LVQYAHSGVLVHALVAGALQGKVVEGLQSVLAVLPDAVRTTFIVDVPVGVVFPVPYAEQAPINVLWFLILFNLNGPDVLV